MLANTVALRGQSRSTYCASKIAGTKSLCRRLAGHKDDCRPTLAAPAVIKPKASAVKKTRASKARKVAPKVVTIPMAEYVRLVAAQHSKSAKRSGYHASGKPSARLA
jgi:hypothetical protein